MVVEPVHSVSILGHIVFCLLDVMFLRVEELFYLIFFCCTPLFISIYTGHFEVFS